jgi:long-chain fatty acid transport protein
MQIPFCRTRVAAALAGLALGLAASQAQGSAFALQEQNASGLGHAYAGGAAAAEDVSTIFYNPAGLVTLTKTQVVAAGNFICPSAKFSDGGSQAAFGQPLGGNGGDAGSCAFVPNLYVGVPFTDKWSFGLGINAPFGLMTEYDNDWLGRFQAVKSKVETININPVLSWEPTKSLTVGAGFSYQQAKATFTNYANYAAAYASAVGQGVAAGSIPASAAPTLIGSAAGLQSFVDLDANDYSWGWNVGILWQATPQMRLGAAYRSSVKYTLTGNASFTNPTSTGALPPTLAPIGQALVNNVNAALYNGGISVALKVPDTANVSIFYNINDRWDVMADLQYTGWGSIQELAAVRTSGAASGATLVAYPENFRDTWRGSVGVNYRLDPKWTLRGGLAYDQSPVNSTDRTPRLPDNNRTWVALGAQYKWDQNWSFDLAYAYIFVQNPDINQNKGSTAANGLISGSYSSNVNIVGMQVTYTMK